jgi:ABC-type polysaccharide/polyol phosphate transport system ATPase subunit
MRVIELEGVAKSFSIPAVRRDTIREHASAFFWPRKFQQLEVLKSISFHVERGESFAIMGRNGCGKSTLLRILADIYRADRGTVAVHAPVTPILSLGLGWNGELSARDNLFLTGTAMGMTLRQLHQQFDEIVAFAELEKFVDLQLKFYSAGMEARLAYAIAFGAVRDVLLLDEIFAVGDQGFTKKCELRYRELHQQGHTLVLVSHSPKTIEKFCTRGILLDEGRVVFAGAAAELAAHYRQMFGGDPNE